MTSKELAIGAGAAVIVAVFAVVFFGWMGGIVFTLALVFVVLKFLGSWAVIPASIVGLIITVIGYYSFWDKRPDYERYEENAEIFSFLLIVSPNLSAFGLTEADRPLITDAMIACATINIDELREFAMAGQEALLPPASALVTEPLKRLDQSETPKRTCTEYVAELSSRSPEFKDQLSRVVNN